MQNSIESQSTLSTTSNPLSPTKKRKSRRSKTSRKQTFDLEKEIIQISEGSKLSGKGSIDRDFCGHDPALCISSVPQWKIVFKERVPSLKFKLVFQPRHQKCYFFSACIKGNRFISMEDPSTIEFQKYAIAKDLQISEISIDCTTKADLTQVFGVFATIGNPLDFGFIVKDNPPITVERLPYVNDFQTNLLITEKPWHISRTKYRNFKGRSPGLFVCKQYIIHVLEAGTVCLDTSFKTPQGLSTKISTAVTLATSESKEEFATSEEYKNRSPLYIVVQEGNQRINHQKPERNARVFTSYYTHELFFFEAKEGDYVVCPYIFNGVAPEKLSMVLRSEKKSRVESLDVIFPQNLQYNIDLDGSQQYKIKPENSEEATIYITFRPDIPAVLYLKWDDKKECTDYIMTFPKIRNDNPEYVLDLPEGKTLILTVSTKIGGFDIGMYSLMVSSRNALICEGSKGGVDVTETIHELLPDITEEMKDPFEEEEDENDGKSKTCLLI